MSAKIKWGLIALLFVLILGGAYLAYTKLSAAFTPNHGLGAQARAADSSASSAASKTNPEAIDVPLLASDGSSAQLFDFLGKPIILNFWASTCGPCRSEMPHFQKAYEKLGDQYQFLMVNVSGFLGETQANAEAYIQENNFTFPIFFDTERQASYVYNVDSLPSTVFIDAEGTVVAGIRGAMPEETLYQAIEQFFETE